MRSILPLSLVMGAIAGALAGLFLNIIVVPVMEWAIQLEEAAAAALDPAGPQSPAPYAFLGTLGMQRVGLVIGLAVLGVIFGGVFAGMFHLVRRALPGWNIWSWGIIAAGLGFLSISLITQLKFPPNPPGVGEEATLLSRQVFQLLIMVLSPLLAAGLCLGVRYIQEAGYEGERRLFAYCIAGLGYAVAIVALFVAVPGVSDPVPDWVPPALPTMFRTYTIIGHFLLWMILGLGVIGYLRYGDKSNGLGGGSESETLPAPHGTERQ